MNDVKKVVLICHQKLLDNAVTDRISGLEMKMSREIVLIL